MGRNRSFDLAEVIEAAAVCFSGGGYEGTSIDTLVAATGVHRRSLYGTFGSKRGLLLQCLDAALLTPDRHLDLWLVALVEASGVDPEVQSRCRELLTRLGTDPAVLLGRRLLSRAGLATHTATKGGADVPASRQ